MSGSLEKYVKAILKESGIEGQERAELAVELTDHLLCLKSEYMKKGIPEAEAEKLAMFDFGEVGKIGRSICRFPHPRLVRLTVWGVLAAYSLLLVKVLLLDNGSIRDYQLMFGQTFNLEPFAQIRWYIQNPHQINNDTWFWNLFGNLLAFMPLGFLLPLALKRADSWFGVLATVLGISLIMELLQYLTLLGIFDVDDSLQAAAGGLLGYLILKLLAGIGSVSLRIPLPSKNNRP
jgi:glycopeptide antibiotics resistance protein